MTNKGFYAIIIAVIWGENKMNIKKINVYRDLENGKFLRANILTDNEEISFDNEKEFENALEFLAIMYSTTAEDIKNSDIYFDDFKREQNSAPVNIIPVQQENNHENYIHD